MPCPHNEITIVQRSQRQSAVAAAAYQSGEKLFCEYDQQVKHYPEKRGIVHNEILLPANAPRSYADRNTLWNAAEAVEKQWNSQLARRWVRLVRSPFSRYFFLFSRRSSLCCSCKSCVSARSFSARSCSRVFGFVIVLDLLFLKMGIKKTVNFSHIATSQRSDFRYLFFQTCWRRTAFYAVCGRQVHRG